MEGRKYLLLTDGVGFFVISLVLPEIQLPSPLPQTLSNKSLLFHPRVAEEARRLLYTNDSSLVPQLVQCLSQTSSKQM